jgi:hypothetical protein
MIELAAFCDKRFRSCQSAIQALTVPTVSRSRSPSDLTTGLAEISIRFCAPRFMILILVCIIINSYCWFWPAYALLNCNSLATRNRALKTELAQKANKITCSAIYQGKRSGEVRGFLKAS